MRSSSDEYRTHDSENLNERFAHRATFMKPSEIRALFAVASRPEIVSFAGGMPNLSALPMDQFAKLVEELVIDHGGEALQYGSGQGHPKLREQICEIMALEGIRARPDDVVVTTGSQQALDLISRIFIDPGDVILVESPSYVGALGTFSQYEAEVVHIALDQHGLIPSALQEGISTLRTKGKRIKFLYLVPNYQNPAGVLLSTERRIEILEICRREGVFVVEDNPYGLLGFNGPSPMAMRSYDSENVIYLGSFSKTIVPGFRIGWVVVPRDLREKVIIASESSILCPSNFSQMAISRYLEHQPWREQIDSFSKLYRIRRDAMLESLSEHFPSEISWTKPQGGFYIWVTLPGSLDSREMAPKAIAAKVAYVPGSAFFADGSGASALRLSYSPPPPERIREGILSLSKVVKEELRNAG